MDMHMHRTQQAFFNGMYLGDVMTPNQDELTISNETVLPPKPIVQIIGTIGPDLACTYKDQVIILTEKERIDNQFKNVDEIRKYVQQRHFKAVEAFKLSQAYHIPKTKKLIGGNPTTLKARKKLLAQKFRGKRG